MCDASSFCEVKKISTDNISDVLGKLGGLGLETYVLLVVYKVVPLAPRGIFQGSRQLFFQLFDAAVGEGR